ncbi:MAG: Formamidopyrimidine-DNA glycosylase [Candidatus Magasanikbacteria bacterium GW2011_GWC2_37_14]|uniref:Formamidopyrimidine-DNA glycosylase n=1 Tax=Candidatus Magasanikbacteria bacterium GW2011_GWC2_37_14 TaxID=1619046 RepID=A0A0G0G9X4_9BACT|nr:MAG: Formamidopyrimidine-DNA glycosylase [Candidatus Magasanikbacteria bacterium GW2011_GWC2_37_14]
MPELPEVETIKEDLKKKIINERIVKVWLSSKAIIKNSRASFVKIIKNNKVVNISRVGKLLIFVLANENYLLIHLKMTGQLIFRRGKEIIAGGHPEPAITELPNKFTRIILEFKNDGQLFFNDIRRFGYWQLVNQQELFKIKSKYGPEPLANQFTFNYLTKILANKNKPIKVALMDQDKIAGIGNIYASEICFKAKINPQRKAKSLSKKELLATHQACKEVLKIAIKNRGTTFSDYVDTAGRGGYNISFLNVYDREGKNCKVCQKAKIIKIAQGGRSSFYCPRCQK